ncbi:NADH dehydrogenase [ubiquinone] flavoprotein 3, mitochondrial isoform X2 [Mustela lutreola]|uniref:NADH dehydrogenase [ubiquinone] flavoprotein 3, mitochondrial isoform X2 n=1 Tax=Mustela lutreola TaxID=9666 RepID=UPI00279715B8|nr:NADH dehydrogenase [ubiquinone] flavoprotein 3, mitochondrial isoform X2 [Mustela lutreola]
MAASLLLRRGRSAALKTVLREARLCRGLASTVSLSAESGKTEKGLPPNSKRQSPPKSPRAQRTVRSRCGYWQDSKVRTTLLSAGEKKGRGLLRMRWAPALENRVAASGACSAAVYF